MRCRGFTLIELLVAVVIVGILAAIAYPSYQSYVQKSRRTDAKASLAMAAQQLERYDTQQNTYATATLGTGGVYPTQSQAGYYNLALSNLGQATYTITATPTGNQASDACGRFTLDQAGTKGVAGGTITNPSLCW